MEIDGILLSGEAARRTVRRGDFVLPASVCTMKTVLPRVEFLDALQAAAGLTGGRTTKPILSCVRLMADSDALEVSATDGETALRVGVPALAVDAPGVTVVPADRLLSIVRELPDVEIQMEVVERHCVIRGAGASFRIFILNPEDYPPTPTFEEDADLSISGVELKRMIHLTVYAAARETSRYAINGVLWEKQDKRLYMVATDGRRLARAGGGIAQSSNADFSVIVPAKALAVLERVFVAPDGDEWTVDVKVRPNQVILRSGDRVLSTVLVDGHFPKYQDVIPQGFDKQARVGRDELLGGVRQAALLTTEDSRAIKLHFESQQLVITSQSPEQGDARVELPIEYEGEPIDIGFNPAFLVDVLKVIPNEEVFIQMQEDTRPGVICGEDRKDFLYVVMPVSL
ncbi:MAG: DNA polymerase III subunit beta [Planctomycetota bacterium]|nr:MAG: DNA polymerase III subunit beta [Planctomycetota bacterium]